ncbi:MAG: ECF transporter S component [Candidatus Natronoplasma sp.]
MIEKENILDAKVVAFSSVFAAAVAIATMIITVPVGLGVLNFGEIVIYTAAFLFGGIVGGLAGGIGAAAADLILGYAIWAPITLVVKGLEGFVVGKVSGKRISSKIWAIALGAPFMIVGYFLATWFLFGFPAAVFQELPIDLLQAGVGAAIAIPISHLLQSYIPQLRYDQNK